MMWFMIFCAWAIKSGGCVSPTLMPSKQACEFALRHQKAVAARMYNTAEGLKIEGRCISVRP